MTKCGTFCFIVTGTLFLATFAVLIAGIVILVTPYDFENLPYFKPTQCTPVAVTVATMPNCKTINSEYGSATFDEYVAIWQCK